MARITYVARIGGRQQRLCRRHYLTERQTEQVSRIRLELAGLFRRLRPWVFGLRGADLALIGAERRAAV